jgi:simple sugar transport system permease protein
VKKVLEFASRDRELVALIIITALVGLYLYNALGSRVFSPLGISSMAIQIAEFGFLALGMGLAMLTGGIDLSVAAAAGLAGLMGALVMSGTFIAITDTNHTFIFTLGVLATLVTGLLTGLLNGFLIAKISVPPILATLGTMIFFTGIGMAITGGNSVGIQVPMFADFFAGTKVFGLPLMFIILIAVFFIVAFLLNRTMTGRSVYLFGENEVALRFAGHRTERTIMMTYVLIGLLMGMAALLIIARANSMRVGYGEGYLLQAILVVVLAGFNPFGGKGRVLNIFIALILLQLVATSINAFGLSPYHRNLTFGLILLVVMGINFAANRLGTKKKPKLVPTISPTTEAILLSGDYEKKDTSK